MRAMGFAPTLMLERRLRILGRSALVWASLRRGLICPEGVGVTLN